MFLLIAIVLITVTSFAWLTVSESPAITQIKVNISGSSNVLIAPDSVQVIDGVGYSVPGAFGDSLNVSDYTIYDYLEYLKGLMPVSTADGLQWIIPDYYDSKDDAVKAGTAFESMIKPIEEFWVDTSLEYANLTTEDDVDYNGSYVYLDFWVVAPVAYELRIATSTGDETQSGSFVVDLMDVATDGETYWLEDTATGAASAIRVGLQVSDATYSDAVVQTYLNENEDAWDSFVGLAGVYQAEGETYLQDYFPYASDSFIIYEPNGTVETEDDDGTVNYTITYPLTVVEGLIQETDVSDILTVQQSSSWNEELLNTSLLRVSQNIPKAIVTAEDMTNYFFLDVLSSNYSYYVSKGLFYAETAALYQAVGTVTPLEKAATTDDAVITTLQANKPQKIRMYIWVEGQDADATNVIAESDLLINIELAGATAW